MHYFKKIWFILFISCSLIRTLFDHLSVRLCLRMFYMDRASSVQILFQWSNAKRCLLWTVMAQFRLLVHRLILAIAGKVFSWLLHVWKLSVLSSAKSFHLNGFSSSWAGQVKFFGKHYIGKCYYDVLMRIDISKYTCILFCDVVWKCLQWKQSFERILNVFLGKSAKKTVIQIQNSIMYLFWLCVYKDLL